MINDSCPNCGGNVIHHPETDESYEYWQCESCGWFNCPDGVAPMDWDDDDDDDDGDSCGYER